MRRAIWMTVCGGVLAALLVVSLVQTLRIGELEERLAELEHSECAREPMTRGQ